MYRDKMLIFGEKKWLRNFPKSISFHSHVVLNRLIVILCGIFLLAFHEAHIRRSVFVVKPQNVNALYDGVVAFTLDSTSRPPAMLCTYTLMNK